MTETSTLNETISTLIPEVLETMFFNRAEPVNEPPDAKRLCARVAFRGASSGIFWMWLTADSAPSLTADFLGVEPENVTDKETWLTMLELANMLCGGVLSRVEADSAFDLGEPEMTNPRNGPNASLHRTFEIDGGYLSVAFHLDSDNAIQE